MALQSQLGTLPERWHWADPADCCRSDAAEGDLNGVALFDARAVLLLLLRIHVRSYYLFNACAPQTTAIGRRASNLEWEGRSASEIDGVMYRWIDDGLTMD